MGQQLATCNSSPTNNRPESSVEENPVARNLSPETRIAVAEEDTFEQVCEDFFDHKKASQESAVAIFTSRLSQVESQLLRAYPYLNLQGERDFASVRAGRQEFSVPILLKYKSWLDQEIQDDRILPRSPIRAAFNYTLNQWDALCRYTEEGYLSMEGNAAERLVKLPAIGRKNFLFVGSECGGRGAATMYSLISSSKANGVEPFAWLKEIFTRPLLPRR